MTVKALLLILLLVIAVTGVLWFDTKIESDDGAPMPRKLRRTLVWYLLLLGPTLLYLLIAFSTIEFPSVPLVPLEVASTDQRGNAGGQPAEAPLPPPAAGAPGAPAAGGAGGEPAAGGKAAGGQVRAPRLERIFPLTTLGTTPTVQLALYGQNFRPDSRVRFNGSTRATVWIDDRLIRATVEQRDLVGKGSITVDLVNPGDLVSNALPVAVDRPTAAVNWLPGSLSVTREGQLLLLVLCAGALGSFVHALMSLTDFIGNRTLISSWFWWYVTRPFLGMAMAFVFYSLLRGGFLAGTPADANVVNPFGAVAIAALVGMFSDKASQKLAELFETLFRADDKRGGKLAAPTIDSLDPSTVAINHPVDVTIRGERLLKVTTIRVDARERKPTATTQNQVTFKLDQEDVSARRALKVAVVDADGQTSPTIALHVTDLAITSVAPVQAAANSAFTATSAASGGVAPYTWSLANAPGWLQIDKQTGALSGQTAAPETARAVGVTVTDKSGASMTKKVDITVA